MSSDDVIEQAGRQGARAARDAYASVRAAEFYASDSDYREVSVPGAATIVLPKDAKFEAAIEAAELLSNGAFGQVAVARESPSVPNMATGGGAGLVPDLVTAFELVITVGTSITIVAALKRFGELLAEDAYQALRRALVRLDRRLRQNHPQWQPGALEIRITGGPEGSDASVRVKVVLASDEELQAAGTAIAQLDPSEPVAELYVWDGQRLVAARWEEWSSGEGDG